MIDPNRCYLKYFAAAQPLLADQSRPHTPKERRSIAIALHRIDKALLRWSKHEDFDIEYITGITGGLRKLRG